MSENSPQISPIDSGQLEKERKIKIWMIDDDDAMFASMSRNLRSRIDNLIFVNFPDGESALAAIATEQPDIILVDGDLGEGHKKGSEIVTELKLLGVRAKIVAFSTTKDSNQAMMASGADLTIKKDYSGLKDIQELTKEIT